MLANKRHIAVAVLALVLPVLTATTPALAQSPNKFIKIVSPAPPGGSTDIISRLVQPGLQEILKQTVIVESRGGAGGYIGSEYVSKAPPDGATLLLGGAFTTITATLQKNASYNPRTDLVPVAVLVSVPNVLVGGPRLTANSVAEVIAQAKAEPGKLNIGSNGIGTTAHLSAELFKYRTGASIVHVAYRSATARVTAITGGEIDLTFDNVSTVLNSFAAGKLRPLAVTAPKRHRLLPDVPTMAEAGVKDAEVLSWFGIMAPAGTPQPVLDTLTAALKTISETPEFKKHVEQQGMDATFYGGADAKTFWLDEVEKWETVIKAAKIEAQ